MIIRLISVFVLSSALLSGCSIYKIDIQQGNHVTQEELSQITPGMGREQVQQILGTPLLTDDFRQNRWDYVFYLQKKGQATQKSSITVFFNEQGIVSDVRKG
uniref:Outer membrane protein assembly factor BamE n=1 Tax=uncultured Thiotrichaceae bacterium TaxID=298394 RepID=A0A6S6U9N8_9GAMM|nr:MAG: Outer membrane protein assembly factor BamE [uncultured Thiotrichaceae bacterium]